MPGQRRAEIIRRLPLMQVPALGGPQFRVAPGQVQASVDAGGQLQPVQTKRDALPLRLQQRLLGAPHPEEPVVAGVLVQRFQPGDLGRVEEALHDLQHPRPRAQRFQVHAQPHPLTHRDQQQAVAVTPPGAHMGQRAMQRRAATRVTLQRQVLRRPAQLLGQQDPGLGLAAGARHMRQAPDRDRAEAPGALQGRRQGHATPPPYRLHDDFTGCAVNCTGRIRTEGVNAMGIIIWLIVGGIVGWLASIIMKRDAQQGIILNIVVGIVGALIAGYFFGGGINEAITLWSFIYSLIGAVILLAIVNLFTRKSIR